MGTYVSVSGGGNASVHVYGNGTVVAGNGNDSIRIDGNGAITVGAGSDHITLHGSGSIFQHGAHGNDTINVGHGSDTITEAGHATVHGSFGSATIQGGTFQFVHQGSDQSYGGHYGRGDDRDDRGRSDRGHHGHHGYGPNHPFYEAIALTGNATFVGGSHCTEFVGGSGSVVMQGGTGNDTFVGGSGHTTMTGGSAHNVFAFTSQGKGGLDVITNFVAGHDKLYLEGQSLCYLQSHGDVSVSHGNTFITLDAGKTVVELKGFSNLTSHDITTHKG
jgi:Ca2+-binding RTX toxin-like protein